MEFVTILLTGLLGLVSPVGLVVDRIAENAIRSQFRKVEQLQVRVDNAPSYQLLQGKVERVRIAGRGLRLKQQDIRIATLELETDPVDLDPRSLSQGQPKLNRPFQAGVHLVLTQRDVNKALRSPAVTEALRDLSINEVRRATGGSVQRYTFANPRVKFLDNNRLRFQVQLTAGDANSLMLVVESGLRLMAGRQIQLVEPAISVNGEAVPNQFVNALTTNLSQRLDLRNFEEDGLQARILKLQVTSKQLEIATFLRVEPSSQLLVSR